MIAKLLSRREIDAKNARLIAELALEAHPEAMFRPGADDRNRRLRGIPAIGRNVSGEIPGTRPDSAVR